MSYDAYTKKKRLPTVKEIEAYIQLAPDNPTPITPSRKENLPSLPSNNGIGYGADSVGGGVGTPTPDPPTPEPPIPEPTPGTSSAYDSLIKDAERVRDNAISQAEKTRDTAVSDAQRAYGQMLSESAQNAEKLARMGLTNSGYSDYLDASAYATKRGEISKAQATYDTNVQNAYNAYEQSVSDANTKRNDSYLALLQSLDSGEISPSVAQEVAKAYGYNPEQMQALTNKIGATQKLTQSEYETDIQSGNDVSATQLNADVIAGNITKESAAGVITNYFDTATKSGDPTVYEPMLKEFDKAYAEGLIDPNTYQTKYNEFAQSLYKAATTIEGDRTTKYNNAMTVAKDIEKLYKAGKITKPVYDSIKNSITTFANSVGAMVGTEGQYKADNGVVTVDGTTYLYGAKDNISLVSDIGKALTSSATAEYGELKNGQKVTYDGVEYVYVQTGTSVMWKPVVYSSNDAIGKILGEIAGDQTPKDGTVVTYQGKYYVRKKGYWRPLTPPNNTSNNNNGNTLR